MVGVRRGTTIAHFPRKSISVGRRLWNYRHERAETLDWDSGSQKFGNGESEFGDIFFDVLSERGFNVVGDARDLFEQADRSTRPSTCLAPVSSISAETCLNGSTAGTGESSISIAVSSL